jgi:hypothetical protein
VPSYPDKKSLVMTETNNTLDKLTEEFQISPTYACIQMGAYCFAQIAALYEKQGKKIPKDLEKFLTVTYPKLIEDQQKFIEEQHLMLNTSGSA